MSKEHIVIAGGTGLVGSRLIQILDKSKYKISILSRSSNKSTGDICYIKWDIAKSYVDPEILTADHVINLAGAGIADKRWTATRKKELIESRTLTTQLLYNTFDLNKVKLKSYVGASAIGYYGDRAAEKLNESSDPGSDFLSDCCVQWEQAHHHMEQLAARSSILRIGIVMSTLGGAFSKIHPPMKLGMANYFGSGKQYYSWIHIDDLCHMIIHSMLYNQGHRVYNAVAPEPMTNYKFTKKIKKGLNSFAIIAPAPSFALRLLLGEMAKVVLNSNRVYPEQILKTEYKFLFPVLEDAVQDIVSREI
jgi:uncharacterized protein